MNMVNKSVKEWNAIIEALGKGKQFTIIRKYPTNYKFFLLFPTFTYSRNDGYLDLFKPDFHEFVQKNLLPDENKNKQVALKYMARIEKIIQVSKKNVSNFSKYHIWSDKHIKSYLKDKDGYIWLLRVYKLKKHHFENPTKSILFQNLKKEIDTSESEPVINDEKFQKVLDEIYAQIFDNK